VHKARPREEVLNFKGYADAVLGELLSIHKSIEAKSARAVAVAESSAKANPD
jgi:hypothetical protein